MKLTPEELTDALLRQRLSQAAPLPPPVDGWQQLETRLMADPDVALRESLSRLPPAAVSNWEALERKLEAASPGDATIAEKLNALQPAPAVSAWATFADKMDARNAEVVDVIVGDQLSRAGAGAVSGWSALAARLELIRDRRQRVYAGAVIELSLLLSLILLLVRFGPTQPDEQPVQPLVGTFQIGVPEATPETNTPVATEAGLTGNQAQLTNISAIQPSSTPGKTVSSSSNESTNSLAVIDGRVAAITPVLQPQSVSLPALSGVITERPVPPASTLLAELEEPVVPLVKSGLPRPALRLAAERNEKVPTVLYAHVFASPLDINQVVTRTLPVNNFDITADNRLTRGHSAGFLLDLMQGGFGVQFGAVYSRVSYIPSALKYYLEEEYPLVEAPRGYSRFVFRKLTLPLSFNQVITQNDRWRWTASATMSVSVAATTSFNISDENRDYIATFNRQVENGGLPITTPDVSGRSSDARVWYKLIDPAPGAFEGGSLFDNANFYVGGGIMLERLLGTRSSVYFNPSFGRVIYLNPDREDAGTGPYQDKIHTGQLRFGARYRLGKGQR